MITAQDSRQKQAAGGGRARPPACCHHGFSLVELLVVISIMVMIIAVAIPIFTAMSSGSVLTGGEGLIASSLNTSRTEAMKLRRVTGVLFFLDGDRVKMAMVWGDAQTDKSVILDAVDDADTVPLPENCGAQTMVNGPTDAKTGRRLGDGYLGFTRLLIGGVNSLPVGGVILFDGHGQLVSLQYGYRLAYTDASSVRRWTPLGKLLLPEEVKKSLVIAPSSIPSPFYPVTIGSTPVVRLQSQLALAVYRRNDLKDSGFSDRDPLMMQGGAALYPAGGSVAWPGDPLGQDVSSRKEEDEETWLDNHGTTLLVNRYNGTLIKGD